MKITHYLKTILTVSVLMSAPALAQGPLTPPGAPAPSMKTLDQVEARTPISSIPFTINSSGSYYLTGNLSTTGVTGITISADNVTLDLNGFTISKITSNSSSISGLRIDGRKSVTVKNGKIRGFGAGAFISNSSNISVSDIEFDDIGSFGISIGNNVNEDSSNISLEKLTINNTLIGIGYNSIGGSSENDDNPTLTNLTIKNCQISNCSFMGIEIDCDTRSQARGVVISNNLITNCSIGIDINGSSASTDIRGANVTKNTVSGSGGIGIQLVRARNSSLIGNLVSDGRASTTVGIRVLSSTGTVVFKNVSSGHSDNYFLATSCTYGPLVTVTGGNISAVANSDHPLANISSNQGFTP